MAYAQLRPGHEVDGESYDHELHSLVVPIEATANTSHIESSSVISSADSQDARETHHGDEHNQALESEGAHNARPRDGSQQRLVPPTSASYRFRRYIPRTLFNILGPSFITSFYLFIVFVYLRRPAVNDIIPIYPVNAKFVFYAWLILSVFVLDWAKSAISGFEASALMKPKLAPANAMHLMWHADQAWGSLLGWRKAVGALFSHVYNRFLRPKAAHEWEGPSPLWWYLAFSSFLLYAAIPLAGLSMDPKDAFKLEGRGITILGTNQSTFDIRPSNAIAESTSSRWRQGNPTTPQGETVFYAPDGTADVSNTYFEDYIQAIYNGTDSAKFPPSSPITFFSGPEVSERAHGNAWGLETSLICSVVHPYTGLNMLKVQSINNWTSPHADSTSYGTNVSTVNDFLQQSGTSPTLFFVDESFGVSYQYLVASTGDILDGISGYLNATVPLGGTLELVMWQSYSSPYSPDATFSNLQSDPSVVSSFSPVTNLTYLGYGIQCNVTSNVGSANLNAASRTYSAFNPDPALEANPDILGALTSYPGAPPIDTLVFAAFTTVSIGYLGPPVCMPLGVEQAVTCNPWYGANVATGGVPIFFQDNAAGPRAGDIRYPTIAPKRMQLAIYRIFGEAAIALMASGPGSWTGNLTGLDPASDLVPGAVPWPVIVALLAIWCLITVIPSCGILFERRWAATLDGFEMFRLGAEWREAVWKFEGAEFKENEEALRKVPGMIGDMEPKGEKGFVGLSRVAAWRERKYLYDRGAVVL